MNRLTVKLLLLVALVWTTWWVLATNGMQRSLDAWFDARRNDGWQAEVGTMTRAGFPLRIATTLTDVSLSDPETQSKIGVPQITLSTPIYWPGHATVRLPAEPITLTTPQGVLTLKTSGTEATLRLHPGTSLQLELMRAYISDISLDLTEGQLLSAGSIITSVQQSVTEQTYDIDFIATEFAPGSVIREALRLPNAWPNAFETLTADMSVMFDRPWDRSALEDNRPQPRAIEIVKAEAIWADLRIAMTADLQVAEGGIVSGTLQLQVQNWERMLDLATASGAVTPQMRPQIESGMSLLSGLSGGSDTLDLDITIDRGRMRMGFIPLGNAPLIVLR